MFGPPSISIKSDDLCGYCHSHYSEDLNKNCIKLPCNHFYHTDCLSTWLKVGTFCPTCRDITNVRTDQVEFYEKHRPYKEVVLWFGAGTVAIIVCLSMKFIINKIYELEDNEYPDASIPISATQFHFRQLIMTLLGIITFATLFFSTLGSIHINRTQNDPPALPKNVIIFKPFIDKTKMS